MIIKKGEVITLSSVIFESYTREGPFVALYDFNLEAYVDDRDFAGMRRLGVDESPACSSNKGLSPSCHVARFTYGRWVDSIQGNRSTNLKPPPR